MSKWGNFIYDRWLARVLERDAYQLIVDDKFMEKAREESSPEYKRLEELQDSAVFMYAKVPVSALAAASFLEEHGFRLIDTNVTLEKPVVPSEAKARRTGVRFAVPDDQNQVLAIAGHGFNHSRFHLDSAFPTEVADATRTEWVRSYFSGSRGDTMVVAVAGDVISGFLLLIYGKDGRLIIDLIAVAEEHRRKGIARDMIDYAQLNCRGFSHIRVGTQLSNLPSLKLYEGMGFQISGAQYTFHYHHK